MRRLFALALFAAVLLTGCAAVPALASFFGLAAPIAADALAAYQAKARDLAPSLPAGDPRLDEIARRLASLEDCRAREEQARAKEAAQVKSSDATALVAALEEATHAQALAQRERDALAAALRAVPLVPPALPTSVLPFADGGAQTTAISTTTTDAGAPQ